MVNQNQNTINEAELNFRLNVLNKDKLSGNELVYWAKNNIFEAIDHHSDNLIDPEVMVHIPEVSMAIEIERESDLFENSSEVQAHIWDQVYDTLKKVIRQNDSLNIAVSDYRTHVVFAYLRTGYLKENLEGKHWNDLIVDFFNSLYDSKPLQQELILIARNKPIVARLMGLGDSDKFYHLLDQLLSETGTAEKLKATLKLFRENANYFARSSKIDFYYNIFQLLDRGVNNIEQLVLKLIGNAIFREIVETKQLLVPIEIESYFKRVMNSDPTGISEDSAVTKKVKKWENLSNELEDMAYVGQAGLVLLAPFLYMFLKNIGHTGGKGQLKGKRKLPMLLHYLVTGETTAAEWKLTLPKILSGLQPGNYCKTKIKPTNKLDTQIKELLNAVIGHWNVLKKTSPDGLRSTFLVRGGKLKFRNGFYYLYVDEHTVDILLNYIPWNYTTIKLNWMKHILFVEWNKN